MSPILVIGIILAFGYVFLVRPSRRRTRSHEAMQEAVGVGDEIISAGGIHGIVKETGDKELKVEIAPGVVVTLDRRAVAAVAVAEEPEEPEEPEGPDEPAPEPEPGAS